MAERPALIDEPLHRSVWRLALPATGALLLRYANHAVDQFWVGRLTNSADSLAAITASNFLIWAIYGLSALFGTGLQAMVARAVGAGDDFAYARAVKHGTRLAIALGLLGCAGGLAGLGPVLGFQRLAPEVQALARQYLAVIFLGLPVTYLSLAVGTIYRAEGDTVTPFRVAFLTVVLNAALDPPFIRGWGRIPAMGIMGSAIVTVAVQVVQLLVLLHLHRRRPVMATVAFEWTQVLRFVKIGLPVAGAGVFFSLVYVALVRVLAPFGTAPVAALGLGHTIEGFAHFLVVGFATAAATLVGQNLGAGRPHHAALAAWRVVLYLSSILLPVAAAYGMFAPVLLGLFMSPADPEVIRYGTEYLRVAAAVQLFGGLELVMWQAQTGAGETVAPTALDICVQGARVPLAAWLAHRLGLGPLGVWLSIGVMSIVGAGGMTALFCRGRWRTKEF